MSDQHVKSIRLEHVAADQLASAVFRLVMEISVLRDRLHTHEQLLQEAGIISAGDIDAYRPDQATSQARIRASQQLIEGVFRDLSRSTTIAIGTTGGSPKTRANQDDR